jgi:hypothetical protein
MNDRETFARLVEALAPWGDRMVFIGGWAHRLYRLHQMAARLAYQPLATLDADVAFGNREQFDGDIRNRLREAGFNQQLTGTHQPPVSKYTLGEGGPAGFYAEFLTPLIGREIGRDNTPLATLETAGITAQRLRYLEVLLHTPWEVTLEADWGVKEPRELRIPNPVSFIVQKLLIHDRRPREKKAQDLLYIHDTLELFAEELDNLAALWRDDVRHTMHENWIRELERTRDRVFGTLNDTLRDAAQMPQDRELDPEQMRAMCFAALGEMLE